MDHYFLIKKNYYLKWNLKIILNFLKLIKEKKINKINKNYIQLNNIDFIEKIQKYTYFGGEWLLKNIKIKDENWALKILEPKIIKNSKKINNQWFANQWKTECGYITNNIFIKKKTKLSSNIIKKIL